MLACDTTYARAAHGGVLVINRNSYSYTWMGSLVMIVRTSLDSLSDCLRVFVCRALSASRCTGRALVCEHWTCTSVCTRVAVTVYLSVY